jgi:hypothetical protein
MMDDNEVASNMLEQQLALNSRRYSQTILLLVIGAL